MFLFWTFPPVLLRVAKTKGIRPDRHILSLPQRVLFFSDQNWIMIFWTVTLQGPSLLLSVSLSKNLIEIQRSPQKSEQRERVLQGGETEERVLQRQNATVACFLHRWRSWLWGSMFMGLTCDISWETPWHKLQKYSPYPVLQGFCYFETHFLSTVLNMIP